MGSLEVDPHPKMTSLEVIKVENLIHIRRRFNPSVIKGRNQGEKTKAG